MSLRKVRREQDSQLKTPKTPSHQKQHNEIIIAQPSKKNIWNKSK